MTELIGVTPNFKIELTGSVTGINIKRNVSEDVVQKVILEVFGDTRALHELLKKPIKITIEETV